MNGMIVNDLLWKIDPHEKFKHVSDEQIAEACGYIPQFLSGADPRTPREQFEANYQFGMHESTGATTASDGTYSYPEDPDLHPYMYADHGDFRVYIYPYAFVAIVNRETGEQFHTRMD